jgi:hypothetical protein
MPTQIYIINTIYEAAATGYQKAIAAAYQADICATLLHI